MTGQLKLKKGDSLILEAGRIASKCYSYYRNYSDSFLLEQVSRNLSLGINKIDGSQLGLKGTSVKIYKNFHENSITVLDQITQQPCIYKDSLFLFNWIIQNDTISILGFTCQKANTYFRGRNYTAWFTNEIPVNNGPLKFGGLPGLILSIHDDKNKFYFECSSVEFLKQKLPITFEEKKYTKLTREEYRKLMQFKMADPIGFARAQGFEASSVNGEQPAKPVKYDPMELE